ncbi:MAG TPA: hypothetical protein VNO22_14520 [Planctomycetota bacterium]|nr:hypothetical protein [Planctomycetota bacterium]
MKLRCPRCGLGRLFARAFRMHAACVSCGLPFEPEPGYYVGAMYLNYGVTAALGLAAGLFLLTRMDARGVVAGLMIFGVVFPVLFFRHSRSLWRAADFYVERRTSGPPPEERLPR